MANAVKLTELMTYIRQNVDHWDQRDFAKKTACGTTFCAAGFRAQMLGYEPLFNRDFYDDVTARFIKDGKHTVVSKIVAEDLELTEDEADELFFNSVHMTDIDEYEELVIAVANDKLDEWREAHP